MVEDNRRKAVFFGYCNYCIYNVFYCIKRKCTECKQFQKNKAFHCKCLQDITEEEKKQNKCKYFKRTKFGEIPLAF